MLRLLPLGIALLTSSRLRADVRFEIGVSADKFAPHDGRIVVYVVGPDRPLEADEHPADWDYCHGPMPVYAMDVKQLAAGAHVTIDATSDHFKTAIDKLTPGKYSAQAVFDWQHAASGWQMEPGNLYSRVVTFEVKPNDSSTIAISLDKTVSIKPFESKRAVQVEVRSKLLSDFAHRDVMLRAGVVLPIFYNETGKYAAIYEIPGFGGTDRDALDMADERERMAEKPPSEKRTLAMHTFHITLNPESPNGHTLFADSDVNGPYGHALVEELIPAIEKQFPAMIAEPKARLLTGHSSGGWAACYLQTHYNDTFGGAWPSSPDPLDFRRFELIDLYAQDNMYVCDGKDLPADRDGDGIVTLSVRDENAWEQTVAPDNRGGLQWQSWQAVFGLPRSDGSPKPLYDIHTGAIDRSQIDHYRKFDLRAELAADPKTFTPIWREKIRLVVGDADDYYLHEAVKLMAEELSTLPPTGTAETNRGYVKIVPGKTHDTIYDSHEMKSADREMLEALKTALQSRSVR